MKYNQVMQRATIVLVALTIGASSMFAQGNAALNGTVTNNGTIQLKGALSGTATTLGGTVIFNGAGQTIPGGYTFSTLTANGTAAKTLGGTVAVSTALTATQAVNVSTDTLILGGTVSGTLNAASGTVNYSNNGAQTLLATTYKNLITSGASGAVSKSAGGAITVTDSLVNGANTTLDFVGNAFIGTGGVTFLNSGIMQSSGTVAVDATASINGTFAYASGSAQTVAPASYTNLTISGAGTKTFTNGATYNVAGIYTPGGATNTYTGSLFNYDGASGQTIAAQTYANLKFSGAGLKTISAGAVAASTLLDTVSDLTISGGSLAPVIGTFYGNVINAGAITTTDSIMFKNTLTNNSGGSITLGANQKMYLDSTFTNSSGTLAFNSGSTVKYAGYGAQTIANATYNNLILINGAKSFTTAIVDSTLFAKNDITVGTALTLAASAHATLDGNLTNNGSITDNSSLVTLNGAGQTIGGSNDITFKNLTLAGTAAKTSNVNLTISGTFTPTYGIDMTPSSKTLTANGTVGSYGALQEVKGTMVVAAATAATYKLNNDSTTVTFTGADASRTFGLTVNPATAPNASYAAATDVDRRVIVSYNNWHTGSANLKLAYASTEISGLGGGNESKIRDFKDNQTVSADKIVTGFALSRVAAGSSFGSIALPGITPGAGQGSLASGDSVVLSARAAAYISIANADWNTGSTWDEGSVPGALDEAIVNTTGVTLNASGAVSSLVINSGMGLQLGTASSALTLTAGLTNNGTLNLSNAGANLNVTGTFTNASGSTLTNAGTITVQ